MRTNKNIIKSDNKKNPVYIEKLPTYLDHIISNYKYQFLKMSKAE